MHKENCFYLSLFARSSPRISITVIQALTTRSQSACFCGSDSPWKELGGGGGARRRLWAIYLYHRLRRPSYLPRQDHYEGANLLNRPRKHCLVCQHWSSCEIHVPSRPGATLIPRWRPKEKWWTTITHGISEMLAQCCVVQFWNEAVAVPRKHKTLAQCWVNVGPASKTLSQY